MTDRESVKGNCVDSERNYRNCFSVTSQFTVRKILLSISLVLVRYLSVSGRRVERLIFGYVALWEQK